MHISQLHSDHIESIIPHCTLRTCLQLRATCRRMRRVVNFARLLQYHGHVDPVLNIQVLRFERWREVTTLSRDRVKIAYYAWGNLWASRTYRRGRLVDIRWYLAGSLHQRVYYRTSGHLTAAYGQRRHGRWYFQWDDDRLHPPNGLHIHRWLVKKKITPEWTQMMFPEDLPLIAHLPALG